MRFGHISEQEARSRLEVAEEENLKLRHKLHAFETASWADAVQECEGWRERAQVAEVALKNIQAEILTLRGETARLRSGVDGGFL